MEVRYCGNCGYKIQDSTLSKCPECTSDLPKKSNYTTTKTATSDQSRSAIVEQSKQEDDYSEIAKNMFRTSFKLLFYFTGLIVLNILITAIINFRYWYGNGFENAIIFLLALWIILFIYYIGKLIENFGLPMIIIIGGIGFIYFFITFIIAIGMYLLIDDAHVYLFGILIPWGYYLKAYYNKYII